MEDYLYFTWLWRLTEPYWALYEVFPPQEARRILDCLEFHYTPKHGSWLNQVEIEISVLSRQCLERRIPDVESLRIEIEARSQQRSAAKSEN